MVRKLGKRAKEAPTTSTSATSYLHPPFTPGIVSTLESLNSGPLPSLFVFDLDYTLWPLWVDTHVDSPLRRRGEDINKVYDRNGQPLSFFPHVPSILFWLRRRGVEVAAASRTSAPAVARQALNGLFLVDDEQYVPHPGSNDEEGEASGKEAKVVKAIDFFDYQEIYPGSKITHFRKLHEDSGVAYEDMVFFDDEYRNAEVGSKLGVHFVEVGHQGTDVALVEKAVREWRAKKAARAKAEL
ncbi:Magnesium-dependent phosphatase-1, eukaryotic/arcaheal type [Kalmanozyma brasiliensis GHG001]|uniref:Magnesium-dependent phosphatase n=1 Tax=Kalmanozyma brasiliensis (strain GHG001) TaxID=1365824 RepID=V5F364_KALBG|nr:Magnesium-dependent phosphatase-1, eukaryotic/arcaheal type [Kalmanozyma brasiliensis GHG001]EST09939.1 Magnesium-dependent phosphatase-1, eukaryotic/arcaheal type [Kalmanozyma brasiliensis GHG001]